jgi:hypothetical protein
MSIIKISLQVQFLDLFESEIVVPKRYRRRGRIGSGLVAGRIPSLPFLKDVFAYFLRYVLMLSSRKIHEAK